MKRRTKIIIAIAIALAVIGIVAAIMYSGRPEETTRTTAVSRGSVTQDVSFTGSVVPARSSDVSFLTAGVITSIQIKAGDTVQAGQRLASLDPRTAQLDAAKTNADLVSTQEQSLVSRNKAQAEYDKTKVENTQLVEEQKQRVRDAKADLDQALSAYQTRADDEGEDSYLAKVAYASYLSARSAYNTAQESLTTLQKTVDKSNTSLKAAADLANAQYLATTQASGTTAGVSALGALAQRSQVVLSQYSLFAPFTGTVTRMEAEVGEYASPGSSLITVETSQELQVKAEVTESDTAKLSVGLTADIVFDALPGKTADARITYIAPSARLVEGVPVYEITLQLENPPTDLRSGLTADVTVHVDKKENTLFIPRRSITEKDGKMVVQVVGSDGMQSDQEVHTGLIGSDGSIEITSGLSEGQTIVLSTRDGE